MGKRCTFLFAVALAAAGASAGTAVRTFGWYRNAAQTDFQVPLALEEGVDDELRAEARELRRLLRETPGYITLMNSRSVSGEEKNKLLSDAFENKVHPYIFSFLRLMNDRGYFGQVPACFARYEERYCEHHSIKRLTVRSAVPLDEAQKNRVKGSVEKKLGAKCEVYWTVDESLVAGLRIEAEGILIENSAKSVLEGLRKHLGSAVTTN